MNCYTRLYLYLLGMSSVWRRTNCHGRYSMGSWSIGNVFPRAWRYTDSSMLKKIDFVPTTLKALSADCLGWRQYCQDATHQVETARAITRQLARPTSPIHSVSCPTCRKVCIWIWTLHLSTCTQLTAWFHAVPALWHSSNIIASMDNHEEEEDWLTIECDG